MSCRVDALPGQCDIGTVTRTSSGKEQEGTKMSGVLEDLLARVARIEAKEACISTFNEYLHDLDGEFTEDLLRLFAPDARLEIMNYPPGTGRNVECNGRAEIRPIYEEHRGIMSRHHSANITVNVRPDGKTADMSAYFITSIHYGLTGGIYEATLGLVEGKWLFMRLRISSNWGWIVPQDHPPFLAEPLGAGTVRKGRPVLYTPPSHND
jgi:SnoaL-like domain